ncbi:MAG: 3-deoxy-7-phosphoheptulonate synthase [Parcubacteria group bacterium Gr01-1014_31]|nr:MAG: 3-deoxy-7-phosphoheptulonate synthase [Parcubacteria group bacterium Gr01-1014_31]
MIIIMKHPTTPQERDDITQHIAGVRTLLEESGFRATVSQGVDLAVVGAVGKLEPEQAEALTHRISAMSGVQSVRRVSTPYKLVSREYRSAPTLIPINGVKVGGNQVVVIAGPCAAESPEQLRQTAAAVKACGAHAFRAGAFKPRSSPYSHQGLGEVGIVLLGQLRIESGLPVVTEITRIDQLSLLVEKADVLQVGMRNMDNYELLRALARTSKPVLLKRNTAASLDQLLQAAEYVVRGNGQVILCLRGIIGLQGLETRAQADLDAIPLLKAKTHLPVIFDPSHAAGRADLVTPLSLAAIAAGADGLIVEVHPDPANAISDNEQQLTFAQFGVLMRGVKAVAAAVGRTV